MDGHSFAVPHFGDSLYYLAFLALDKIPDEFGEFCDQFKRSLSVFEHKNIFRVFGDYDVNFVFLNPINKNSRGKKKVPVGALA